MQELFTHLFNSAGRAQENRLVYVAENVNTPPLGIEFTEEEAGIKTPKDWSDEQIKALAGAKKKAEKITKLGRLKGATVYGKRPSDQAEPLATELRKRKGKAAQGIDVRPVAARPDAAELVEKRKENPVDLAAAAKQGEAETLAMRGDLADKNPRTVVNTSTQRDILASRGNGRGKAGRTEYEMKDVDRMITNEAAGRDVIKMLAGFPQPENVRADLNRSLNRVLKSRENLILPADKYNELVENLILLLDKSMSGKKKLDLAQVNSLKSEIRNAGNEMRVATAQGGRGNSERSDSATVQYIVGAGEDPHGIRAALAEAARVATEGREEILKRQLEETPKPPASSTSPSAPRIASSEPNN